MHNSALWTLFRLATLLPDAQNSPLVLGGLAFIVTGIGFKLGRCAVPSLGTGCL